jgi:hypothetical protein
MEQLLALLEQLGITPEDLEAAMAAEGGAGGGMPPVAPAGAPGEEPKAEEAPGMEVEARAKAAAAKKGASDSRVRDYIQEVLSRSRS